MLELLTKLTNNTYLDADLYDQTQFYQKLTKDLKKVRAEVIIESPFITKTRLTKLLPLLTELKSNRVKVIINTRDPNEHKGFMKIDAQHALSSLLELGIQVIFTKNLHRKLVILDRTIVWEGSLNVLSQNNSQELMRRTSSSSLAWKLIHLTKLDDKIS